MKRTIIGMACLAIFSPLSKAAEPFSKTSIYRFKEAVLLEAGTDTYHVKDLNIGDFPDISTLTIEQIKNLPVGTKGKVRCSFRYLESDRHNYIDTDKDYILLKVNQELPSNGPYFSFGVHTNTEFRVTLIPRKIAINADAKKEEVAQSQLHLSCHQAVVYKYGSTYTPRATITNWFPSEVTSSIISKKGTGNLNSQILSEIQNVFFDVEPVKDLRNISIQR